MSQLFTKESSKEGRPTAHYSEGIAAAACLQTHLASSVLHADISREAETKNKKQKNKIKLNKK